MASFNSLPTEIHRMIMEFAVPEVYFVRFPNNNGVRQPDCPLTNLLLLSRYYSEIVRSVIPPTHVLDLGNGNSVWGVRRLLPDRIRVATVTIICRIELLRSVFPIVAPLQQLQRAHIRVRGGLVRSGALLPANSAQEFNARLRTRIHARLYPIVPLYRHVFRLRNPTSFLMHADFTRQTGPTHEIWVITNHDHIETKARSVLTLS